MRLTSLLFVPADSARKFEKAQSAGADALILDLEDSVAPSKKVAARTSLGDVINAANRPRDWTLWVRVNPLGTGLTELDLQAVVRPGLDGIMLPKSAGGVDVTTLSAMIDPLETAASMELGQTRVIALATETPAAMFALASYAPAHPRLAALTWGAEDLSAELGATANRDDAGDWTAPYQMARNLCLIAAANAGVPAIDTIYADFGNTEGLVAESRTARRDGFIGKMAIHPAQVETINETFAPTAGELELARQVVQAFEDNPDKGAIGIGGKMYDIPHLKQARRVLASVRRDD